MPPPLNFPPVDGQPVHFLEAIRAAGARHVVLPDVYYGQLQGVARQLAFSIAGIASHDQLKAVMDSLSTYQANGKTFAQWQREIVVKDLELPRYRLENIFRTNLQGNYQAGHWEQIIRNQQHRPYLMYDAINDSRTRPAHRAMDGIIRPIDHPFWKTHSPPNGYMCRCGVISLTEAQAQARSKDGTGLNKSVDETKMQPDKGWGYSPRDRLQGVEQALAKRLEKNSMLSSALAETIKIKPMTLEDIRVVAEKIKPEFDNKIQNLAESVNGLALLPALKSNERAIAKIQAVYGGDASLIRDVLRAGIIVDNAALVNDAYKAVESQFNVIKEGSRNGYAEGAVHSSDGYFAAKLDISIAGIYAEIQIHTQAMWAAKEKTHALYEQRQAIIYSLPRGVRPTPEQKKAIEALNKQMRNIYREASNND